MPWYKRVSVLHNLEKDYIGSDKNHGEALFPVQQTSPGYPKNYDFHSSVGRVAREVFKSDDPVIA